MTREKESDYELLITLRVVAAQGELVLAGTVFHDGKPRIVRVGEIAVDTEFAPSMIYVNNDDKPGFIGRFAGLLGDAGINIATFALGRDMPGGSAVALVAIDGQMSGPTLEAVKQMHGVKKAAALAF